MGDRHYRGTEDREPPGVAASWWRIAFSWLVALAFLSVVGPVSGDKAGAFVLFVLLFPVIALLMAVVAGMGLLALFNAIRCSGPGARQPVVRAGSPARGHWPARGRAVRRHA